MVEKLSFEEREADPGALEAAREVTSRVRPIGTRMLTAIAALAVGAWGLLLAVDNAYESYVLYPEMEREMLLPAIILVVFANSLVTCCGA